MDVLLIFLFTIVLYFATLVSKTILEFKRSLLDISLITALRLTMYVFFVHVKIAHDWRSSFKKWLFVYKQFFFRYDVSIAILVEVINAQISESPVKTVNDNESKSMNARKLFSGFFNSNDTKEEYKDILNDYCLA